MGWKRDRFRVEARIPRDALWAEVSGSIEAQVFIGRLAPRLVSGQETPLLQLGTDRFDMHSHIA